MDVASWSAVAGLLLLVMALSDSVLARLPLSTSMLYLAVGVAISPLWLGWVGVAPATHAHALERIAEIVVLLSLFGSGLKMSVGLRDGRWLPPVRLATLSMVVTVTLIALVAVVGLGLPLGAAILLGGILAPTDPVLASDVQIADPTDRDRLRFSLTGEAGLNDGSAFPFVLLGLGLLGLHDLGDSLWRWFALDVVWSVVAGLAIGAALGTVVGRFVLYLRRRHKEATGLDNFLALGLIGISYGLASLAHGYGFLAVFAAGVALRRLEQRASAHGRAAATKASATAARKPAEVAAAAHASPDPKHAERAATHPRHAPAFMAHAVLSFNEQIERIAGSSRWSPSVRCSGRSTGAARRGGSSRCCSASSVRSPSPSASRARRRRPGSASSSAGSASAASARSSTLRTRSTAASRPTRRRRWQRSCSRWSSPRSSCTGSR
jgi:hypothetical protein